MHPKHQIATCTVRLILYSSCGPRFGARYVSCGLYMGTKFCTQSSNRHVHCSINFCTHPAVLDLARVTYPAACVWGQNFVPKHQIATCTVPLIFVLILRSSIWRALRILRPVYGDLTQILDSGWGWVGAKLGYKTAVCPHFVPNYLCPLFVPFLY